MQVHVKLFSRFRKALPPETKGEAVLDLPRGMTIEGLLDYLGIGGRIKLIAVNGEKVVDRERVLHDGDQVKISPIVVGG